MDIILLPGLWLDQTAWSDVVPALEAAGHQIHTPTLPGQGDGNTLATLDDQIQTVLSTLDQCASPALVVGHSAAATLAWLVADRRPEAVARVALIGGMPCAEGEQYASFFEPVDGLMSFPGWDPFAGPDSDDLGDEQKASIASKTIAMPATITHAPVHYTDPRRHQVPVVLVCPEFSTEDAKAWFEAGDMPELTPVEQLSFVDIDSGHWPMFSQPESLARVLADCCP